MKNRKLLSTLCVLALLLALGLSLAACGESKGGVTIAIPNDTTNEARALLLLERLGYITLKEGAGITATPLDIASNPKNITFNEVEAAQLPNVLKDVDYAVINSNYALDGGLNPTRDALGMEGSGSYYANILAVKEGRESDPLVLALVAALESQQVAEFIAQRYDGAVVSTVDAPTDGYDPELDYEALAGQSISVAASPTPHAEILAIARDILAEKGIELTVLEFTDYVQPNNVVDSGEVDANYFQHVPYLDDFNAENGTHVVSVAAIHVEPMGFYGGRQSTLDALK
ncbi:MAG: hypothetical protein IKS66_03215 [Oscillospiraceae bacterium]|nr:hypothetical protein [Oscillospiraceae bacterium]